jgi:hypothetical protein
VFAEVPVVALSLYAATKLPRSFAKSAVQRVRLPWDAKNSLRLSFPFTARQFKVEARLMSVLHGGLRDPKSNASRSE